MTTPKVSFFIPAYNCAATLEQTVESIFDGNCQPGDEVVIVNDGSTDDTKQVSRVLQERHPAIRAFDHRFNRGGGAARNTAVGNASHDVLFCLDSDNVLQRSSVPRLRQFMVSEGCDVTAFQSLFYFVSSTAEVTHKWRFRSGQTTLSDYLAGAIVPGASGNYMFTRESWLNAQGYPEFAGALDAWGFGLRQVARGQRMMVLPDSHYFHRHGHESYWVREARSGKTSMIALQLLIPFLDALQKRDVDYVMSRRGRYGWFENLDRRPLRVVSGRRGLAGTIEEDRRPAELRAGSTKRWIRAFVRLVR